MLLVGCLGASEAEPLGNRCKATREHEFTRLASQRKRSPGKLRDREIEREETEDRETKRKRERSRDQMRNASRYLISHIKPAVKETKQREIDVKIGIKLDLEIDIQIDIHMHIQRNIQIYIAIYTYDSRYLSSSCFVVLLFTSLPFFPLPLPTPIAALLVLLLHTAYEEQSNWISKHYHYYSTFTPLPNSPHNFPQTPSQIYMIADRFLLNNISEAVPSSLFILNGFRVPADSYDTKCRCEGILQGSRTDYEAQPRLASAI